MKRKIHREDIIQSGFDLFYEKGYGVTGIKEITERIEIPKGSFYNHFESKEAFGLEVLDFYNKGTLNFINKILFSKKNSPLKNLEIFFDFVIKREKKIECTKGCMMGNMTMELSAVNSAFQSKVKSGFNDLTNLVERCLINAQNIGELSKKVDAREMAYFIINSWHGALLRMKADKTTDALKTFKKTVFHIVLK